MPPQWILRGDGGLSVAVEDGLVYVISHGRDGQAPHHHALVACEIQDLVRALVLARREAYGSYWA